jgi:hypothetical protein
MAVYLTVDQIAKKTGLVLNSVRNWIKRYDIHGYNRPRAQAYRRWVYDWSEFKAVYADGRRWSRDGWYNVTRFADLVGVTDQTVRRWLRAGTISCEIARYNSGGRYVSCIHVSETEKVDIYNVFGVHGRNSREYDCIHYPECLDSAAKKSIDMNCDACRKYERDDNYLIRGAKNDYSE